jgi:hypothetical protein
VAARAARRPAGSTGGIAAGPSAADVTTAAVAARAAGAAFASTPATTATDGEKDQTSSQPKLR